MNSLPFLASEILKKIEPDSSQWAQWLERKALYPCSQSEAMQQFRLMIETCKANEEKIFVAGDYDCDGIMATTILVDGLRRYGLEVGFYIPDRIREGYGLHPHIVRQVAKKGYACIVTVDNGVKAFEALNLAKELGLKTIVTDHHTIEQEVPCDCLVHPDTLESCFESECGAAIAYECCRVLHVDTSYSLELAAIASIGDVMQVTKQTRAIIQNGLQQLNLDHEKHLTAFVTDAKINETTVAFQIVPALNAVGRLSNLANVNNVVRYFLSKDLQIIASMQSQIKQINKQRKQMSDSMVKQALLKVNEADDFIMVSDPSFHEGIIGLVAGNLSNRFQKPCIIMTENQEGYKGSMRSPNGFNCMDFFSDFSLFDAFGGHAQAAGFSISIQNFSIFRDYVRKRMHTYVWELEEIDSLMVDANQLSVSEIEGLDCLRPFGPGFECPLLEIKKPQIKSYIPIQNGKHGRYHLMNGLDCLNFNQSVQDRCRNVNQIESFIGKVQINQYRGQKKANFVIEKII